jgi:hypothetical protein
MQIVHICVLHIWHTVPIQYVQNGLFPDISLFIATIEILSPIRDQRQRALGCIHMRLRVQSTHPRRRKPALFLRMIDNEASVCATFAWFLIAGPSCWRTTTNSRHWSPLFYHRQPLEHPLTPSLSNGIVPVVPTRTRGRRLRLPVCRRTLKWHTKLVQIHGTSTQWWTVIYPPMLCKNKSDYVI